MNIYPEILEITLDPTLTYNKPIDNTTTKIRKTIQIIKALTSTTWGKQQKTIVATYKAITRPILEYDSTIWSPLASDTNINEVQITQNTAVRITNGCTTDPTPTGRNTHQHTTSTGRNIHQHTTSTGRNIHSATQITLQTSTQIQTP